MRTEFPFGADVELEDLESGRKVLTGSAAAADYRRAFASFSSAGTRGAPAIGSTTRAS